MVLLLLHIFAESRSVQSNVWLTCGRNSVAVTAWTRSESIATLPDRHSEETNLAHHRARHRNLGHPNPESTPTIAT